MFHLFSCLLKLGPVSHSEQWKLLLPQFRPHLGNWKGMPLDEGGFSEAGSLRHQAGLSWALLVIPPLHLPYHLWHVLLHCRCEGAESWFFIGCLSPQHGAYLGKPPSGLWLCGLNGWLFSCVGSWNKRLPWANQYFFLRQIQLLKSQ